MESASSSSAPDSWAKAFDLLKGALQAQWQGNFSLCQELEAAALRMESRLRPEEPFSAALRAGRLLEEYPVDEVLFQEEDLALLGEVPLEPPPGDELSELVRLVLPQETVEVAPPPSQEDPLAGQVPPVAPEAAQAAAPAPTPTASVGSGAPAGAPSAVDVRRRKHQGEQGGGTFKDKPKFFLSGGPELLCC